MYIIFTQHPDGDSYSLHGKLKDAQYLFHENEADQSPDTNIFLCEITDPSNFGWGSHGDAFGMDIIQESNQEL